VQFESGELRLTNYAVSFACNKPMEKSKSGTVNIGFTVPLGAICAFGQIAGESAGVRVDCADFRSVILRFVCAEAARDFKQKVDNLALVGGNDSFAVAHRRATSDKELNAWRTPSWLHQEYQRLGLATGAWRLSRMNHAHGLIPSYPELLAVPGNVTDEDLVAAAEFRRHGRFPVVCWRHPSNGTHPGQCHRAQPRRYACDAPAQIRALVAEQCCCRQARSSSGARSRSSA
jgi:hypothetical protein